MKQLFPNKSCLFSILFLLLSCYIFMPAYSHSSDSSTTIHIALYADKGTLPKCIDKTLDILSTEKDMTIDKLTQKDILEGKLKDFNVFLLPGGTASGERESLGKDGCQKIIEFVKSGNGIIATCAGAYLVSKGWNESTRDIQLINAEVNDLDHWVRGVQKVECKINRATPSLKGKTFQIHFENGPPLIPSNLNHLPDYISLATYVTDLHAKDAPAGMMSGKDAIIASYYGEGKVLLFSPHPELTPGLERMLVQAVRWAAKQSNKKEKFNWETIFGNNSRIPDD